MAITAPGHYGLTLEKQLIDTLGLSMEAETMEEMLVLDAYNPDYSAHDFRSDVTANEVSGTNYTAGGVTVTGTELTISSGTLIYDYADTVYTNVTIANAMAGILHAGRGGADTADELILLQDFVNAASATAANFTIQHPAGGVETWDFTP